MSMFRWYNATPRGNSLPARLYYHVIGTILFITIWSIGGYLFFSQSAYKEFSGFLPIPTAKALYALVFEKDFWESVLDSLRRVGVGITIAFFIGLPFGLVIGFYRRMQLMTYTPIQLVRMISPVSWMPIALLVFKSFESAIYFLIAMATVWPIVINTTHGVSSVNPQWVNMARNQGAKDYQLLIKIIIPASVPYIITSLRLALGVAWIVLVPAEFLGVSSGLGYIINDARDTLEYDRLMAILIAIGVIGYFLDTGIELFEKMIKWQWE